MSGEMISARAGAFLRRLRRAARGVRLPACLCACALASVGVALACGWSGPEHSVRFGGWGASNERAFSRLPPLSIDDDDDAPAARTADDSGGDHYTDWRRREDAAESAWAAATAPDALADRDSVERTRATLRAHLDGHEAGPQWETQPRRNT
ncbi:MAG: hypothetical protein LC800_04850, partial [Acidobacteria bacterium]|nr:hypothetical protein [Acidobacteriota bacterium]